MLRYGGTGTPLLRWDDCAKGDTGSKTGSERRRRVRGEDGGV